MYPMQGSGKRVYGCGLLSLLACVALGAGVPVSASTVTWVRDGRYHASGVVQVPTSYGQSAGYPYNWGRATVDGQPATPFQTFGGPGYSSIDTTTDTVTADVSDSLEALQTVGNIYANFLYGVQVFDVTFQLSGPTPYTWTASGPSTDPVTLTGPDNQVLTLVGTTGQSFSGTLDEGLWEMKAVSDPSGRLGPANGAANFTFNFTATPEPTLLAPLAIGFAALAGRRARRHGRG